MASITSTVQLNPLQVTEDERGDPTYDEELEICRQGMEAMGYSAGDYDDFRRAQTSDSTEYQDAGNSVQPCTALGDRDWAYRMIYVGMHLFALVLLLQMSRLDWTTFNVFFEIVLFFGALGLYFTVQGSDPGYVDPPEGFVAPDSSSREAREKRKRRRRLAKMRPMRAGDADEEQALADAEGDPQSTLATRLAELEDGFPPMRTILCKAKGRHVAKFDHFCGFLNTPIGEKNHFRFWWFLLFESALILHTSIVIKTSFRWFSGDHDSTMIPGMLAVVFLDLLLVMIGGLWVFHTFLALTASTTFEFMRGEEIDYLEGTEDMDFPFSGSATANVELFCWTHGFKLLRTPWTPHIWRRPVHIDRQAEDCWNHPWQNKYYSCC